MKLKIILSVLIFFSFSTVQAQNTIVVDGLSVAAIHTSTQREEVGQEKVVKSLNNIVKDFVLMENLHNVILKINNKLLNSLKSVNGNLEQGILFYKSLQNIIRIANSQGKIMNIIYQHPQLIPFGQKMQTRILQKSNSLVYYVRDFILKGGSEKLLSLAERRELLLSVNKKLLFILSFSLRLENILTTVDNQGFLKHLIIKNDFFKKDYLAYKEIIWDWRLLMAD